MMGALRAGAARIRGQALPALLRALAPRAPMPPAPGHIRRILVSGGMGIGNAVMLEPLLHALRERFPQAHIAATAAVDSPSLAVLRWPGMVDEVIPVRGSSLLSRWAAGFRLARGGWDLCVVRFNGVTYEILIAALFGRIPYRAGHVSGGRFASRYDWLFNLPVTMGESEHEVDRYLALAERLGHVPTRRAPALHLSSSDRAGADRVLDGFGLSQGRPVVALQPGTSRHQSWKRWPTANWRALAQGLREAGLAVVALGSSDERELLDQICRDSGAFNAAGACTISEAAAILERCQVLVSTDSGLMHIADAVGTPVVGILGPTDWSRTRPYGKDHVVLTPPECRGHHTPCLNPMGELSAACTWGACMQSIRPEAVLACALQRCQKIPC